MTAQAVCQILESLVQSGKILVLRDKLHEELGRGSRLIIGIGICRCPLNAMTFMGLGVVNVGRSLMNGCNEIIFFGSSGIEYPVVDGCPATADDIRQLRATVQCFLDQILRPDKPILVAIQSLEVLSDAAVFTSIQETVAITIASAHFIDEMLPQQSRERGLCSVDRRRLLC